jgi:hypothetical protein
MNNIKNILDSELKTKYHLNFVSELYFKLRSQLKSELVTELVTELYSELRTENDDELQFEIHQMIDNG